MIEFLSGVALGAAFTAYAVIIVCLGKSTAGTPSNPDTKPYEVKVASMDNLAVDQVRHAAAAGATSALTSFHMSNPCPACDLWRKNFLLERFPEERDRIMREVLISK